MYATYIALTYHHLCTLAGLANSESPYAREQEGSKEQGPTDRNSHIWLISLQWQIYMLPWMYPHNLALQCTVSSYSTAMINRDPGLTLDQSWTPSFTSRTVVTNQKSPGRKYIAGQLTQGTSCNYCYWPTELKRPDEGPPSRLFLHKHFQIQLDFPNISMWYIAYMSHLLPRQSQPNT